MFRADRSKKSTLMREYADKELFHGIVNQAEYKNLDLTIFLHTILVGQERDCLANRDYKVYIYKDLIFEPAGSDVFRIFKANTASVDIIAREYCLSPYRQINTINGEKDWEETVKRLGLISVMSAKNMYGRRTPRRPRNPADFKWETSDQELIAYIKGFFSSMAEILDARIDLNELKKRMDAKSANVEELKKKLDALDSDRRLKK